MAHLSARPDGVLPRQEIKEMVAERMILSKFTFEDRQFQPASLDLRLGEIAHRVQCSFLPGKEAVRSKLTDYTIHTLRLIEGAVLEQGVVYVIPLVEHLKLPAGIRAKANPRSSTGRLDIFTRVISDHNDRFDEIDENYEGPLYLEVLSRSFPIRVHREMSLSQIRFMRGTSRCDDDEIEGLLKSSEPLLYEGATAIGFAEVVLRQGLHLRVDLSGIGGRDWVGYKARRNRRLIDLSLVNHYNVLDFWEPIFRDRKGQLVLEKDEFYLLTSKERVRIPPKYAAEMVAYEETSGELRTHYAGFFDPGFGYGLEGELSGTVAVMEVRVLDAPFMVEDGQRFCKLQVERMAAIPDKVYGSHEIGSSYHSQGLNPSKHFRPQRMEEINKRYYDQQYQLFAE